MSGLLITLRGLPFKAKEQDIADFLEVNPDNILTITIGKNSEGRPSGDAEVTLAGRDDLQTAMSQHKKTMAGFNRYVEVFDESKGNNNNNRSNNFSSGGRQNNRGGRDRFDGVVKCRGLPYACTPEDILNFFDSCQIAPDGVTMAISDRGDCAGEAFVQFMDFDSADAAISKDRQEINGRYVELFKSSNNDRRKCIMANMEKEHQKNGSHAKQQTGGWGMQQQQQPPMMPSMNQGNQMAQFSQMNQMNPMNQMAMMTGMNNPMMAAASQGGWGTQSSSGGGPMKSNSFGGSNRAAPYQMPGHQNSMMMPNAIGMPSQQMIQSPSTEISPDPANPFPHKVVLSNVEPNIQNAELQEFFKPHKPIAVNNHLNGTCEVAFKNHQEASSAMIKNGEMLGNNKVGMVLESKAPQTGWSTL